MLKKICKGSILIMSGLLIVGSLVSNQFNILTFIFGLVALLTNLPFLSRSFRKLVYIFILLSLFIIIKYKLPMTVLVSGVNSMLNIVVIVTVMQLFYIPITLGDYNNSLTRFLQSNYKKETSLYSFLSVITHLLGSFMSFGTVPMLFSIFKEPLDKLVHDSKRFTVTAMSRSFSLVPIWAPGAINVNLALQATGTKWMAVFPAAFILAILGLITSIFMEYKLQLKGRAVNTYTEEKVSNSDRKKILILVVISAVIIAIIAFMEKINFLAGTARVIIAGFIVVSIWILSYARNPGLYSAWKGYWNKSLSVVPDLASLFISIGIFTEVINQAGLIVYLRMGLVSSVSILGQFTFLIIPLIIILLSLIGLHPFISIIFVGNILVSVIELPHYNVIIALSLLLGGVISYCLSPFSGNVMTLSGLVGASPKKVGIGWNGLFSIIYLVEGLVFIYIVQLLIV